MILCVRKERSDVEKLISDIRSELSKTPYTCAIGAAYISGEDLDSVCARADAEMYKDKQLHKAKAAI